MRRVERQGKLVGLVDDTLTGADGARQTHDAILQFVGRALLNETQTLTDDDAHWLRQSTVWLRELFKTLAGVADSLQESDPEKARTVYNSLHQMMTASFDAGIRGGVSKSGAKYVKDFGAGHARKKRAERQEEIALTAAIASAYQKDHCARPSSTANWILDKVNAYLLDKNFGPVKVGKVYLRLRKLPRS